MGVPKTAVDLKPGTYKYKAKIAMGGQQIALTMSTIIKEEERRLDGYGHHGYSDGPGGRHGHAR